MIQTVKFLPAVQEIWVRSLDRENPLEKGIATHSSILAWRLPWTEEPGGLQSIVSLALYQINAAQFSHCFRFLLFSFFHVILP